MISLLLTQMDVTDGASRPVAFLDFACGSGMLTLEAQMILTRDVLEKSTFLCAEAQNIADLVKRRVVDGDWVNTEVRPLDAMVRLPADSLTSVGLGMALHVIPDPDAVLAEFERILKPRRKLGASVTHRDGIYWATGMRTAFAFFPFSALFSAKVRTQMHQHGD
ncbi:methyltransferase tpcH [Colletotrichum liriopes]|uniref:Methyltransferase tpcH n=1 Tax=Colletotrichum liriopes TaxID=708192 RepID=A0AA37GKF8_9PEZI|nr:methyltransferase tpcH [Colletotrichum liriopes]